MNDLEQRIKTFADSRWPQRELPGRIRKLGEEFGELAEAVAEYQVQYVIGTAWDVDQEKAKVVEEAADCAIILADLLALLGISLADAMAMKLQIIEARP